MAILTDDYYDDYYKEEKIRAVDAKFLAQQIAFSPLTFQAVKALLDLKLMQIVEDAKDFGISLEDLAQKANVSLYGVKVLSEMALGMKVFLLSKDSDTEHPKVVLGKIGWMLLEDELTRVNFNFCCDVCYKGAFDLTRSIREGKPCGLQRIDETHNTVYEALSSLPKDIQKSWFEFDHFYSSIAFQDCLEIVFSKEPKHILDIGGNTAKWALTCCNHSKTVKVTIVDLPGQVAMAKQNVKKAGFENRVDFLEQNILDESSCLPCCVDVVWMSQFLDCFSLQQVTDIFKKIGASCKKDCNVYVLEPLWDKQKFLAASYSLQATSLYFTCIANGCSKMYRYSELAKAAQKAGFFVKESHHNLGSNAYSLLLFQKE